MENEESTMTAQPMSGAEILIKALSDQGVANQRRLGADLRMLG